MNTEKRKSVEVIKANRWWASFIPIVVMEIYLFTTVLIFFFGPVNWFIPNPAQLLVFLCVNYGGLAFGYWLGVKKGRIALTQPSFRRPGVLQMSGRLGSLILISMMFCVFSTLLRLYVIRGSFADVFSTLIHPGEAYAQAQLVAQMDRDGVKVAGMTNYSWGFRISTLFAVFNGLYFPLVLACWRRLKVGHRVFFFVPLFCTVLFTLGVGAQSGIGLLLFALLPVVLFKIYVSAKPVGFGISDSGLADKREILSATRLRMLLTFGVCTMAATIIYFQLDRAEAVGGQATLNDELIGVYGTYSDNPLVPITGGRLNYGVVMLCLYVCHGYEGLALSMDLPFEWTYGLGWSKALQVIYHDYMGGQDLFEKSYLARNEAEHGWPSLTWWSTIFPWIASDTTYYGTVFFLIFVGFIIGRCWMDVVVTGNPIGLAVLGQMFTLVFMFPANNALAQSLDSFFALLGVFIIYFISRRYFVNRMSRDFKGDGLAMLNKCYG